MTCNVTARVLIMALLGTAVSACSPDQAPTASAVETSAPSPVQANAAEKQKPTACALVTAQEMSAILGSTVAAKPDESSFNKTECIYSRGEGPGPYIDLTVGWGDGEAITAMGAMGRMEPGLTNPYQGIGDQAVAVGTGLMIRTGDDLVTIMFSGVDDAPGKAKKIFDTAKARM